MLKHWLFLFKKKLMKGKKKAQGNMIRTLADYSNI